MFLRPMLLNLGKYKIRPGKWPRKGPERDIGKVKNIIRCSGKAQEGSKKNSVADPDQIERKGTDPHQSDKLNPDTDPHLSDKLDPDHNPHQFADEQPKMYGI